MRCLSAYRDTIVSVIVSVIVTLTMRMRMRHAHVTLLIALALGFASGLGSRPLLTMTMTRTVPSRRYSSHYVACGCVIIGDVADRATVRCRCGCSVADIARSYDNCDDQHLQL